jgi:lysophospholipase L1-like esterase
MFFCLEQGCWRALLWQKLQAAGVTNTHFVGTLPAPGCGFQYDGANEGHGGYLATGIVSNNQLPGWLSQTNPDIVMMHLGTNDVWNNKSPADITAAFTTLVAQMRANNSNMKILVGITSPERYEYPGRGREIYSLHHECHGLLFTLHSLEF